MAEQVETKLSEENTTELPTEILLVITDDVPDSDQEENNLVHQQQEQDEKHSLLVPEPETMTPVNNATSCDDHEPVETKDQIQKPPQSSNHNKSTNVLPDHEQKALLDLKQLLQQALDNHEFDYITSPSTLPPSQNPPKPETKDHITPNPSLEYDNDGTKTLEAIEETIAHSNPTEPTSNNNAALSIWGVNLLVSEDDNKTDVILTKFLRARDFKPKEAFNMLKNTIKWRHEFDIDKLVEQDDDHGASGLDKAVYMHGYSKEGHPVCYNVYGVFADKEIYQEMFSDEEKRQRFLRLRIQILEKCVRKLDFGNAGVSTIVYVNDLKDSPGPNRWELRQATNQALQLFQDNYPEFVAKQVFINVPWWYLALSKMIGPFLTQRSKSKFVVAGPSGSTETLLKYISAEQIPTQYGGLSKDGDFGFGDVVTEIIVKPSGKHIVEIPVTQEPCIISWEARVVGWEVNYGAEFVPSAEDGYTIIIQKMKRTIDDDHQLMISSCYKACEAGKLVLTFKNLTSKKKKLLYRFKTKLSLD